VIQVQLTGFLILSPILIVFAQILLDEPYKFSEDTRSLGLVVCRGTSVVLICPQDGMESIANPFVSQDA
jgi:hypothetical protein